MPQAGPAVAAVPAGGGRVAGGQTGGGVLPAAEPALSGATSSAPAATSPVAAAPSPPAAVEGQPTVWLNVHGGSVWLGQAASGKAWLEADGLAADVPIGGAAADGRLTVDALRLAGAPWGAAVVPLRWQAPVLSAGAWSPPVAGLKCEVRAQMIPAGPLPFFLECAVPGQEVARREWWSGWSAGARVGEAFLRAGGYLRSPSTWQGEGRAAAVGVVGGHQGSGEAAFDEVRLWVGVHNGVLIVHDLRVVGEAAAMLGNGLMFADGRLAANGRLVLSRDAAFEWQQRAGHLLETGDGGGFRPLETPDRWALDARLGGTLAEPWVEFGDGPTQRVRRLIEEWHRPPAEK